MDPEQQQQQQKSSNPFRHLIEKKIIAEEDTERLLTVLKEVKVRPSFHSIMLVPLLAINVSFFVMYSFVHSCIYPSMYTPCMELVFLTRSPLIFLYLL